MLKGGRRRADYAATIPHQSSLFQLMFAIITPALISGFAERMKFSAFVLFMTW